MSVTYTPHHKWVICVVVQNFINNNDRREIKEIGIWCYDEQRSLKCKGNTPGILNVTEGVKIYNKQKFIRFWHHFNKKKCILSVQQKQHSNWEETFEWMKWERTKKLYKKGNFFNIINITSVNYFLY